MTVNACQWQTSGSDVALMSHRASVTERRGDPSICFLCFLLERRMKEISAKQGRMIEEKKHFFFTLGKQDDLI